MTVDFIKNLSLDSDSTFCISTTKLSHYLSKSQHIWPAHCIKPSKWQLMPNTCCGFFLAFLAGLSVSSRTICWLDPCGIMSAGIGSEIKVLVWQKRYNSEQQRKVVSCYQIDKLLCASLHLKPHGNKTGPLGANELTEEGTVWTEENEGFHCKQFKLWSDVSMFCSIKRTCTAGLQVIFY